MVYTYGIIIHINIQEVFGTHRSYNENFKIVE